MTLRVLIVEDESVAAQAHAEYVGRVAGFEVAGVARSGVEAMRHLKNDPGVDLILLKPFTFAGLRGKLEQYAAYKRQLVSSEEEVVQEEVDQLIGMLRTGDFASALPKGMSADTLRQVTASLRASDRALSASEVAAEIGSSRVMARRYLEHLGDAQLVERQVRYGGAGRPEVEYHWRRADEAQSD